MLKDFQLPEPCYTVIAIQAFSELVISMQTLKVDIK